MSEFYVEYSVGPRFIDGINIELDANATTEIKSIEIDIADPVTGLLQEEPLDGYEPGQKNKDGTDL